MEEKIINISNPIIEEKEKYREYARKKINVEFLRGNTQDKRYEYLEEDRAIKDVNSYLNQLKTSRIGIHIDSLNRTWKNRLLWNFIMLLIGAGVFFAIPELSQIITSSFSWNASVMGTLSIYLVVAVEMGLFYYVNQKKFYFKKGELEKLDNLNKEIERCNNILGEIVAYKEKEREHSIERSKIDNDVIIQKNRVRNASMHFDIFKYRKEARERIDMGVKEMVSNASISNNYRRNLELYDMDLEKYQSMKINRKGIYKRMMKGALNWVKESFEDYPYEEYRRGSRR